VGSKPMTNDPPAISRIVTIIAGLRPLTSANRPRSQPPIGRKKNATA